MKKHPWSYALLTGLILAACGWLAKQTQPERIDIPPTVVEKHSGPNASEAALHIFDRSPSLQEMLFSTNYRQTASADGPFSGDLWLRNPSGENRRVAGEVTRASFSPNGKNFVYATIDCQVAIETTEGELLAQLTRSTDPAWSSDGSSVSLVVLSSVDSSEYQRTAVYELESRRMIHSSGADF